MPTTTTTSTKHFYGLLVGINQYAGKLNQLYGCEDDVKAVDKWLSDNLSANFQNPLKIKKLIGAEATKENVTLAFLDHLGQAKEDDTVFFYFSGHGAQEKANDIFKKVEDDDKLETILLFDSRAEDKDGNMIGMDLADKELRYLLSQVSNNHPKIICMFDCCHSGGNVRDMDKSTYQKRIGETRDEREWNDFLFSETQLSKLKDKVTNQKMKASLVPIKTETFLKQAFDEIIQPPMTLQLAACNADESAQEKTYNNVGWRGIFTKSFFDILDSSNQKASYYDLIHQTRKIVKRSKEAAIQNPQIYASESAMEWMYDGFLGGDLDNKGIYGTVQSDKYGRKWTLGLGAIHGIFQEKSVVSIKDVDGNEVATTTIEKINPDNCDLTVNDELKKLRKTGKAGTLLKGYLGNIFASSIRIGLVQLDSEGKKIPIGPEMKEISAKIQEDPKLFVLDYSAQGAYKPAIIDRPKAHYHLVAREKEQDFIIASVNDATYSPIVKEVSRKNARNQARDKDKVAKDLIRFFKHISHWKFVKELKKPNAKASPIGIKGFMLNRMISNRKFVTIGEKPLDLSDEGSYLLDYQFDKNVPYKKKRKYGFFRFELTNNSNQTLRIVPLMLLIDFSVSSIPEASSFVLKPQSSHEIRIALSFDDEIHKAYDSAYIHAYLKLFISEKEIEFDMEKFKIGGLPAPKKDLRDMKDEIKPIAVDVEQWTTQLASLKLRNPYFKER